jgi:hypothetical protein
MDDMERSIIFMHDRLKRFIFWVPFEEEQLHLDMEVVRQTSFFHQVAARMPSLTCLDLRMDVPSCLVTTPVTDLLTSLPALQTIILPNYHITSAILASLSTLPRLGVIMFEWGSDQGDGSLDDVQQVTPTLTEGAFPALWDLSLTANLSDMRNFLEMSLTPMNLTNLYVHCPCSQNADDVGWFLKCVADNCQMLKALYLELLWIDPMGVYTAREDCITFETLKPLLACSQLV